MQDWLQTDQPPQKCGAKIRTGKTAGKLCQKPAMANGRCRLHGGLSPGAPKGAANGNYKSGFFTKEAITERRALRDILKRSRDVLQDLED